jgi:regulator of protease activity HflC (stomatin/prohibitin superfamily)
MLGYFFLFLILVIVLLSFKRIPANERGSISRLGRKLPGAKGPGFVFVTPLIDRLEKVSIEKFSVSLPPQSAITQDEIPIQLQASLVAEVRNPDLAVMSLMDWRVFLTSALQSMMKDRLEELDFDTLPNVLPDWTRSIREQLNKSGASLGVEVTDLQISNLSPRTRPQG